MEFGIAIGINQFDYEAYREDVRLLYEKYKDELRYQAPSYVPKGEERRFYVYEWFTKNKGYVFYVGKGTKNRYRHILDEVHKNWDYELLHKSFGIDYRFVAEDLTSEEAEVYEFCWIRERLAQGEVLQQFSDLPFDNEAYKAKLKMNETRSFVPRVEVDPFWQRYFDIEDNLTFDPIESDSLLYTYFRFPDAFSRDYIKEEQDRIKSFIEVAGGRVYKGPTKGAKSAIDFDMTLDYQSYLKLKESGCKVYHSLQVLEWINSHESQTLPHSK